MWLIRKVIIWLKVYENRKFLYDIYFEYNLGIPQGLTFLQYKDDKYE